MRLFKVLVAIGLAVGVFFTSAAALAAFGIDPGKVYIDNLFPGAEGEFPITIYNQNDYETTFVVRAREPDYTAEDEGYGVFPYLEWITVTPGRVIIGASDTGDVLITVAMPEDADYSGRKSEVWISFMEEETEGMIKIEIASRIFISTRVEEPAGVEPAPAPEAPAVQGNGAVGITAEAGEPGTVPPEAEPVSPEAEPVSLFSPWVIIGSVLGVLLGGGVVFFLLKRRQRA